MDEELDPGLQGYSVALQQGNHGKPRGLGDGATRSSVEALETTVWASNRLIDAWGYHSKWGELQSIVMVLLVG